MNFTSNGSYEPYAYLALLQLSLFYLQRFGLTQLVSSSQDERAFVTSWFDSYCLLKRLVESALSWSGWVLAFYVGYRFEIANGILFFIVGFGSSFILMLVIPPFPRLDIFAHLISISVTAILRRATSLSIKTETHS